MLALIEGTARRAVGRQPGRVGQVLEEERDGMRSELALGSKSVTHFANKKDRATHIQNVRLKVGLARFRGAQSQVRPWAEEQLSARHRQRLFVSKVADESLGEVAASRVTCDDDALGRVAEPFDAMSVSSDGIEQGRREGAIVHESVIDGQDRIDAGMLDE